MGLVAGLWRKIASLTVIKEELKMFECFHCGEKAVIWDSDYEFSDLGYEGTGIIHLLHCTHCGAEIEYAIKEKEDKEK